jgi:hypothetical protein
VFEIQKRGRDRVGLVKKSRISTFEDTETFPFSYEEISRRYGEDILEKDSIAQELATKEQIERVLWLIDLVKFPEEKWQKWLDKSNADKLADMASEDLQKCIDYLDNLRQGKVA